MFKKLLIVVVAVFVLAAAGGGLWVWQGLQTLKQPVALDEPVLFNVPAGTGFSRVARQLENVGYVSDALWLRLYGRLYPDQTRIKAGDYEFLPGMTPVAMVDAMVEGKVKLWSVQFIEGWTFRDMRAALARSERLKKVTSDWTDEQVMAAVGAEDQHPEGWFFPDTYMFSSSESDLDILKRAHNRMVSVLEEEWQSRAEGLPYDTPYEALIMASIVERETGVPWERGEVAGVFVRRLQKGMRLQTDPTVIYGMGDQYQGVFAAVTFRPTPPITLTESTVFRPHRLRCPGGTLCTPLCIRRTAIPSTLLPVVMVATSSPEPWRSTRRRSGSIS